MSDKQSPDPVQIVVAHPELLDALKVWLATRGLVLFPIPVDDDLPTYGITLSSFQDPVSDLHPDEADGLEPNETVSSPATERAS